MASPTPNKEPMIFDSLEPIIIPVKLGDKWYCLREASESVSCKFQNARLAAARFNDGKLIGVQGAADVEMVLVQGCLFEVKITHPNGDPDLSALGAVAMGFVGGLKASIVKQLYQRALEISNLDDKETLESIDEKIEALTLQRKQLLEAKVGTSDPKEVPEVTAPTSS